MKTNSKDPIEKLLLDTFDEYKIPEYQNSWTKIKTKVAKQQFFKFNPLQFNVFYGVAVAGIMAAATLYFVLSETNTAIAKEKSIISDQRIDNTLVADSLLIDTSNSVLHK
ncbi:MAG: hypothetical protein IPO21_10310 [Bacteroidales bacterium]|nr:hypothetical protein [Bacteroidales bacterium]